MGYLCVNFSLPRPLCSRLRRNVRNRQTDVRQTSDAHRSLNAPTLIIFTPPRVRWVNKLKKTFKKRNTEYLFQPSTERLELAEDVERFLARCLLHALLGAPEGVLVVAVEVETVVDAVDDGDAVLVPDAEQSVLGQVTLARLHHLIGHLVAARTRTVTAKATGRLIG